MEYSNSYTTENPSVKPGMAWAVAKAGTHRMN